MRFVEDAWVKTKIKGPAGQRGVLYDAIGPLAPPSRRNWLTDAPLLNSLGVLMHLHYSLSYN